MSFSFFLESFSFISLPFLLMDFIHTFLLNPLALIAQFRRVISVLALWELVWKGIALRKAGRNNQQAWFVCILIFNTMGILPILYILLFQNKKK